MLSVAGVSDCTASQLFWRPVPKKKIEVHKDIAWPYNSYRTYNIYKYLYMCARIYKYIKYYVYARGEPRASLILAAGHLSSNTKLYSATGARSEKTPGYPGTPSGKMVSN